MRPLGKPNDPFAHVGFRHFREKNNSAVIPITRITARRISKTSGSASKVIYSVTKTIYIIFSLFISRFFIIR